VLDHVYVGVDRFCGNCSTPSSASAAHCPSCGSPLDSDDKNAPLIQAPKPRRSQAKRPKRISRELIIAGVVVLIIVIAAAITAVFWTQAGEFVVSGHSWERTINVERYSKERAGAWCKSRPSSAYNVRQERRQSGTRSVANGESCSTVKRDRGDGTCKKERVCKTLYRKEAVYAQWCDYYINRWVVDSTARNVGNAQSPEPAWPALAQQGCRSIGCRRPGAGRETYSVSLQRVEDIRKISKCDLPQPRGQTMQLNSRWTAQWRIVTDGVVCGSLQAVQ
jgi:hypothetical protein